MTESSRQAGPDLSGVTILGVTGSVDRVGGAEKAFRAIMGGFRERLGVATAIAAHVEPQTRDLENVHVLRPDGAPAGPAMVLALRRLICEVPRPAVLFPFQINPNVVAMMANLSLPPWRRLPVILNDRASIDFMTRAMPSNHLEDGWRLSAFRAAARFVYRRADVVVANAARSAARTVEFIGRPSPPVHTIYNALPAEEIQERHPVRDRSGLQGTAPLIAGHGRLDRQKGWDLLIRAMVLVRERIPDARLLIVGEGGERDALEALAGELGISEACDLPGWDPDPLNRIAECDVYALPSRFEGLPNSLLEAVALGLPAVAADCDTGPDEIVGRDGEYGLLVGVDEVEALAIAILRILRDASLRVHLAQAARQRALDFTLERNVQAYARLFAEVLGRVPETVSS